MDNKIIHASANANFSGYTYVQVYCGGPGQETVTINGTTITMGPGNPIDIVVSQISGGTNVYLIGFKKIITSQIL
jgi:hypothetical protein